MGIGASAGGLEAVTKLLRKIPEITGMAFVLVQHLDPDHESALAELLGRVTSMPVREVTDGLQVEPNRVYVIPPDKKMSIERGVLKLQPRGSNRAPPHSIDYFLESLAHEREEQAIGVILSGTATDGTLGLEAIKSEGGITFAQDVSAAYPSMPRSAVAAGCVDFELSPERIAKELVRIAAHPLLATRIFGKEEESGYPSDDEGKDTPLPSGGHGAKRKPADLSRHDEMAGPEGGDIKKILLLLDNHAGVDFRLYKSATIRRRIVRRMVLNRIGTLEAYTGFLRGNKPELDSLYSDLLISVTSFFRNPEAFEFLKQKVFPKLIAQPGDLPVRIWTLGCSTGQEAYSLAMAFAESVSGNARRNKLQIFATDLNDAMLEKARAGLYSANLAQDISPERLRRFFVEETGGYRITKELRQCVVFARQNVLIDPPFSRMDLISCRNLMIYLEPELQKKIMPMFHYALNPEGVLFLGPSESIAGFTDLFEPIDKKLKLFVRKSGRHQAPHVARSQIPRRSKDMRLPVSPPQIALRGLSLDLSVQREADRITVGRFSPPGVLINDALQILQFRGATNAYLAPPTGKASFDILKMAADGLRPPLRAAIAKARKEGRPVRKENIRVRHTGGSRTIALEVIPLKNLNERHLLVLFEEDRHGPAPDPHDVPATTSGRNPDKQESRHNQALKDELAEIQDYLQSVQDQNETANEELQAANEEVTSANEELQSVNEELETSKEELESSNEELTTVNEEMAARNAELFRLNADLSNLQTSINTAILVVGRDLTIRHLTPEAEKIFNLTVIDLGRRVRDIRHSFHPDKTSSPLSLEDLVRVAVDTVTMNEQDVRDENGNWYSLRVRPYLTFDNKIDGAVLVFVDIDTLKRAEQQAISGRNYAEAILRTAHDPFLVLRGDLRVDTANDTFYRHFKTTKSETEGCTIWELGNGAWNVPQLRQLLEEILPRKSFFNEFEVNHNFPRLGPRTMLLNARRLESRPGVAEMILLGIEDVTERLRLDDTVRRSEERFRVLVASSAQIVWIAQPDGTLGEDSASWRMFTGQTPEQCLGWRWLDAVHPDDRTAAKKGWMESVTRQNGYEAEYRLRRADGIYCWTTVRAAQVLNRDGSVREWIGTNTDITGRRQAEEVLRESEERYRSLFNSIDEAFCVIEVILGPDRKSSDFRFLETNPAFETQSGLKDAVGRQMRELVPELSNRWFEAFGNVASTNEPIRFEMEAKAMGRWFDVCAFRLGPEGSRKVAVLFTNTTARRENALELERRSAEVVAASRAKDEFLAALSHELRTPLTPALLLASAATKDSSLPSDVRADFDAIRKNISLEARLIDDLLDLTRISQGKLKLEMQPCDVHDVLRDSIAVVQSDIVEKGLRLSQNFTASDSTVIGDPVRLAQIFWNVLRNAVHFTPSGGKIHLESSLRSSGKELEVAITDTGVGIPAKDLERIFDAFSQGGNNPTGGSRRFGGLGLGLAISRNIVQMHGGSIYAMSPGSEGGSTFVIKLPTRVTSEPEATTNKAPEPDPQQLGAAALPDSTSPTPSKPDSKPPRILVVDDHAATRGVVERLLRRRNAQVFVAGSVADAVDLASRQTIDVVISDIGLPDGDGYSLIRQLKAAHPSVRGIALSGYGMEADVERSREAGFTEHLTKPISADLLFRAIDRLRD